MLIDNLTRIVLGFSILLVTSTSFAADEDTKTDEAKPADRYELPKDANVEQLFEFIDGLSSFRPKTFAEFQEHQKQSPLAIKAAAERILELEKDMTTENAKKALGLLLQSKVQNLGSVDKNEQLKIYDEVKAKLAEGELGRAELSLAFGTAQELEKAGNTELAVSAYTTFGELFVKNEDAKLAGYGEKMIGSARRVNLPGNEMEIKGTLADGKEFDWKSYRGKVVLVDYWATWCGPCISELPNVKENYAKYHDKGFEVVGISLDSDRERLEKFIADREVPWVCLFKDGAGWDHPMASHYGIMSIPRAILVDKEGKVVSMNARGGELGRELEKLLGASTDSSDK